MSKTLGASQSVVVLDRGYNTSCTVNLHGCTITSWRIYNEEQFFISREVTFDCKRPIRGGVTTSFPIYGEWDFGHRHGFARYCFWYVDQPPKKSMNEDVEATFALEDSEYTRSMWNYKFKITVKIILAEKELIQDVTIENTSKYFPFRFTTLRHTLFKVPDVEKCEIIGFGGSYYLDRLNNKEQYFDERDKITVSERMDRIYLCSPDEVLLTNVMGGGTMKITSLNFSEYVLWNPWKEQCLELDDMGNDEYKYMMAIEAGIVVNPIILQPNEMHNCVQSYRKIDKSDTENHMQQQSDYDVFKDYCP